MSTSLLISMVSMLGIIDGQAWSEPVIKLDGSSTVFPISEAAAEDFQIQERGKARITVGISGTGGGFKKFCRGEIDIANASRPIHSSEIEKCKAVGIDFIELPVAFDGTVVVVHPENKWLDAISVGDLKKIWEPSAQGEIHSWNQVRPEWPKSKMHLFGAGSDSGTFEYFTEAIVGKSKASRGDYTASEDDNTLIQGVAQEKNALGYLPMAYFVENQKRLKAVGIRKDSKSPPVMPTYESIESGAYVPLSRPIFIYVNLDRLNERPQIEKFLVYYLKEAQRLVPEAKYVALPKKVYELAEKRLSQRKTGSLFNNHSSQLTIEQRLSQGLEESSTDSLTQSPQTSQVTADL